MSPWQYKDKEQAVGDFLAMIRKSWTYERLTDDEKARYEKVVQLWAYDNPCDRIKGNYVERFSVMQMIYDAFLAGVGYTGMGWRDK